ncbi:RES family NAD+ phosphorylase [Azohydromonas lata]|uniref:RES family NAD+ phosphorylase n=1 Tax=Azohydromonas lata TaxID=45677 RepID=A0ABU5I8F7_9BURK|nr:RES family NAD+ phosphorylase [Azohydromonas lata]MDZ5455212.1 RES family NAD+ phosphorylase [Azohydromonas lata]
MRAPERGTCEHLLQPVEVPIESPVRLSRHPATEPWWGRVAARRFDDSQQRFGVCYAADQVATAFVETVIHESSAWRHGSWLVATAELAGRWIVPLQRPARPQLLMADLTGTAFKALGLNNDLCSGSDYTLSQHWARAIHHGSMARCWSGCAVTFR